MGNKSEGDNTSNKKLIILLSVLAGIVAVLVIAILVVHNILRSGGKIVVDPSNRAEMISLAEEDCEGISSLYGGGAIDAQQANEMYHRKMAESDDNSYKVHLTICYTDNMHYAGMDLDKIIGILEEIEPLLIYDEDYIDYYDRFIVYYIEADDWDKAFYYDGLRSEHSNRQEYETIFDEDVDDTIYDIDYGEEDPLDN